ncbi:type VI secretion system Vgr family protein [Massilia sp. S19_KUP03_FR1]|uniref:type VI secretion system Vgr family protein n=1 Tax=Massilia sp. S19_KUP03_FR1 TaxID=3025503 RepID=UPI002FCDDEB6
MLEVLRREKSLSTANRPLRLRLHHPEGILDDVLLAQRITGDESICGGIHYRVACLASTPLLALKELIALPAQIDFVTDRGHLRSICGIVTEARAGDCDGGLATYHLVLRDAMAIMEKRINSRIFRFQSELDIVQTLFDEWRRGNAVLGGAFDYAFDPLFDRRLFPPREQTMQYNESDAHFIARLLRRRGVSWYVRPGNSRHGACAVPAHTIVLFTDARRLPQNAAGTVRYHRDHATEQRDTITSWSAARALQPGSATRHSWDYKNPQAGAFMSASARSMGDQGVRGNELAASLDDYQVDMPHVGVDVDDHWRLGQLRISRHEYLAKCFYGEGSVRDFCAGEYFTLTGHPEIDQHAQDAREFVITELHIDARNNLPPELHARAERLLHGENGNSAPIAGAMRVHVTFSAVRRGVPIVPAFDPATDLPHPQLQSAIVVGPANEEVHCDALGRIKIRFPGMRAVDHEHAHGAGASGTPCDSAWVRVASNWAGSSSGIHQQAGSLNLPRVGSEVLVAFLGGDPDKPIVLSQLFNGHAAPPALSALGGLPGNRYLSGMRSKEVGGARGSQLRFDDTHGQIGVQLASDHARSELNLGWLAHPRADGAADARGQGAELRSDQAVAVRGVHGVLISAEAASEEQLARPGLSGLADLMQGVLAELERQAVELAGDEQCKPRMQALVDKLKRWQDGADLSHSEAIVAASAPAGMILASQDNLALGAETKIDVVCSGDTEVAAGRNVFLRAARALSLFAFELGIKLVAARGDVVVKTHRGNVQIRSSGKISLVAADAIEFQAPSVKVVAQGVQTDWGDGAIIQQSSGRHTIRAARLDQLGPGGGAPVGLHLPDTKLETDERMVAIDRQTGLPARGRRYTARHEDGTTMEGVTDEQGRTEILTAYAFGEVEFRLHPEDGKGGAA